MADFLMEFSGPPGHLRPEDAAAVVRAKNSVPFSMWSDLEAVASTMSAGDMATVMVTDTGTHTDPVSGPSTPNAGIYEMQQGYSVPVRISDLDSQRSKAWSQSSTPPDPADPTSKSAKGWSDYLQAFFAPLIRAVIGPDLTFGEVSGDYALKIGATGVDLIAAPEGDLGKKLAYITSLQSMLKVTLGDDLTFGSPDGQYALSIGPDGVEFVGKDSGGTVVEAETLDGVAYDATDSGKQQVYLATGSGSTKMSDGTANDSKPQIVGEHIRMLSDRDGATVREMRLDASSKSVVSARGSEKVYLFLALGQSTSMGSMSAAVAAIYTTVANYVGAVLRFNRGVRPIGSTQTVDGGGQNIVVADADIDRLVPLTAVLDSTRYGETHLETLAYRMFGSSGARSIVCGPGIGGATYAQLQKGTVPYSNAMKIVQRAYDIVHRLGWDLEVVCTWDQGEANAGDSAAATSANVRALHGNLSADIKAITGQTDLHLFVAQTSSLSTSGIPIGQWLASKAEANIHCVGPRYDLPYVDSFHPSSIGYTLLGDIYWRAIKTVIFDKAAWKPLQPLSAVRSGNVITVTFEGMDGNVVLDTTGVVAATNYGVEYFDDTSSVTISSVAVTTTGCTVTLSDVPTGANPKLRFAYTKPGSLPAPSAIARTNFTDSNSMAATYDGRAMPKRLVHSEINVT